jgi:hypothetical protein
MRVRRPDSVQERGPTSDDNCDNPQSAEEYLRVNQDNRGGGELEANYEQFEAFDTAQWYS